MVRAICLNDFGSLVLEQSALVLRKHRVYEHLGAPHGLDHLQNVKLTVHTLDTSQIGIVIVRPVSLSNLPLALAAETIHVVV